MNKNSKKAEDVCTGLAVFTLLLACSLLFDIKSPIENLFNFSYFYSHRIIYLSTCIIAIWTIVKPSSLFRFLFLVVSGLATFITYLPVVPNHIVLEIVVLLTILTSFFYLRFKRKNEFNKTKFYELFAPILRIELIVLYFHIINISR